MTPRRFGRVAGLACLLFLVFAPACRAQDRMIGMPGKADPWVQLQTPSSYQGFWDQNLACLDEVYGLGGVGYGTVRPDPFTTLGALKFYAAGDSSFVDRAGRPVYGEFYPPDTIVVAALLADHPKLIRHEMLHAMGIMYHPIIPFVACGLWSIKPYERGVTP